MKKLFLALLCAGFTSLLADGIDIKGLITNIDNDRKTITINGALIQILPQTKIKLDECGIFGMDLNGKFVDLTLNSFVEAEVFPNASGAIGQYATPNAGQTDAPVYVADEVEVKCRSNRAY